MRVNSVVGVGLTVLVVNVLLYSQSLFAAPSQVRAAVISVDIDDSSSTYTPGDVATYVLDVSNTGDADLSGVNVQTGAIPAGMTINSWNCSPNAKCGNNNGTGPIDVDVDVDQSSTVSFTINASFDSGTLTNPMVLAASAYDTNNSNALLSSDSDSNTILLSSDLTLSFGANSNDDDDYTPGLNETFTFNVANLGFSDATAVGISSNNITGMTVTQWRCVSDAASQCSSANGSGNLNTLVDIQEGGEVTFEVDVNYASDMSIDPLVYTIDVNNPNGANESDSKSLGRLAVSNLSGTLTDGVMAYTPGLTGQFVATFNNAGPSDIDGVELSASQSVAFEDFSWTCSATSAACPSASGSADDLTVDIQAGGQITVTYDVDYFSSATENPLVFSITGAKPAGIGGTNIGTVTDNNDVLDRQVNLSVTKTASGGSLVPNEPFEYTLLVSNAGPSDLGAGAGEVGVNISDVFDNELIGHGVECNALGLPCWRYCPSDAGPLQGQVTLTDCPGEEATFGTGQTLNANVRLASGASSEIKAYVQVVNNPVGSDCDGTSQADKEICNTVNLAIDAGESATTTHQGAASDLTDMVSNEIRISTDLVVTKTDSKTQIIAGHENSYEITVRNDGFINVVNASVTDILPLFQQGQAGFVPGSISMSCQTSDSGACCVSQTTACGLSQAVDLGFADELHANIDLNAQTELTFTVTGTVDDRSIGTLSNDATAQLPAGILEDDDANNIDVTDDTAIVVETDLEVTKNLVSADPDPNNPDLVHLVYAVQVKNLGPSVAIGAQVNDPLDDVRFDASTASWTCDVIFGGGQCQNAGPVTGAALNAEVDLNLGSIAEFIVEIDTDPGEVDLDSSVLVNTVTVQTANGGIDPENNNNIDFVDYSLSGAAEIIVNHEGAHSVASPATPGLETSYSIQIKNEGPDNVFLGRVKTEFPADLEDVHWTCSSVSPIPGDLTFAQSSDYSDQSVDVVVSPDGRHVYVAVQDPDDAGVLKGKVLVFNRDTQIGANFGLISNNSVTEQGENGVDGIEMPVAMEMTADGRFLYVLSEIYNGSGSKRTVAIFARDANVGSPSFGELTYAGNVGDLLETSLHDLAISADMNHLYLSADNSIIRYEIDAGSGGLGNSEVIDNVAEAGTMTFFGERLYVANATGGQIKAYLRTADAQDPNFGALTEFDDLSHPDLSAVNDLLISNDGRHLYALSGAASGLSLIDIDVSTGIMTLNVSYDDAALILAANESLQGASAISISPEGQHVIFTNTTQSRVVVLKRNSQGVLSKLDSYPYDSPTDVVLSPDGEHVFLASDSGNQALSVYHRKQPDPIFSLIESEVDGVNGVNGQLGPSASAISPDGTDIYVTALGSDALVHYKRDKTKGSTAATRAEHLNYVGAYFDGVNSVTGLADVDSVVVTPNGDYVFVGSSDSGTLAVFERLANGGLSFLTTYHHENNEVDGLLGVSSVIVDETSQYLYLAGRFEASVASYKILANGVLKFINSVSNAQNGVSGLAGARSLAFAPDQDFIYVTGSIDDALVVLSRDASDGSIQFVQKNGFAGDQPMDAFVSPDGEHVYVVSANDSRLSIFKRQVNPSSPQLGHVSLQKSYQDGVQGIDYLLGARSVVGSHTGDKLYVGAEFDAAITVFDRDNNPASLTFGELSVVELKIDGVGRVNGLSQLYDLTISGDSKHIYAAGFADHALSAFVLGSGSSCSALGTGNIDDVVDIGSNGVLTYSINAKIKPSAHNDLVTEAIFLPPDNFEITNAAAVNACIDDSVEGLGQCDAHTTALLPAYDLVIDKTNNRNSAIPGEPTTYDITVRNLGPSDARSERGEFIMVKDVLNSGFDVNQTHWTCEASGSGALTYLQSIHDEDVAYQGLEGVTALAYADDLLNNDDAYVIAVSAVEGTLMAFALDEMSGMLLEQTLVDSAQVPALVGARDVAVFGNHIYVSSQVTDSLMVFEASDQNGLMLSLLEQHDFVTNNVFGLNQAVAVEVSDDGKHVYVAGANDNSLVIFNRDMVSGLLSHHDTITHGDAGIEGLSGVNAFALSPDGSNLYSSSLNLAQIGVFKRDEASGDLTFINVIDSQLINESLNGISAITVSQDNKTVYLTNQLTHQLLVFSRDLLGQNTDPNYGSLQLIQVLNQGENGVAGMLAPSQVQVSADGMHVYITAEQSDAVVWFGRDSESGLLTFTGLVSDSIANTDGLNGALDVVLSGDGNQVYVAGSQDDGIAVLGRSANSTCPAAGVGHLANGNNGLLVNIEANGSLNFKVNTVVATDATVSVTNTAIVRSCTDPITPDFETCQGLEPIEFDNDNNTSADVDSISAVADLSITKTDGLAQYDGLQGAVKVTGTDRHVYVAAKQENAIGVYAREEDMMSADFGSLSFVEKQANSVNGVSGLAGVSDVLISADGLSLYATGSSDNSVVVFSRNVSTGELTYLEKHSSGVFGVTGIEGANALGLSPDGKHLYVNGPLTNSIAVFEVNDDGGANHGLLQFKQSLQNAVAGVSGLVSVSDLAVAADGKHVYVTSQTENSVSVFLRNPNSGSLGFGELSYMQSYQNGENGIGGLVAPSALTLSQSNGSEYLYVLGAGDAALLVFARATDGSLSFIEFKQNGTSGVVGLNQASDLVLSDDELSLYVAGNLENSLVQFSRSDTDGRLTFGQAIMQGDSTATLGVMVNGLTAASGVMVSPDDAHVYVAAAANHAVTSFDRLVDVISPQHGEVSYAEAVIDGQGGISPGSEVSYRITVTNHGPSDVVGAHIVDVFPAEFEQISYQCFHINSSGCAPNVTHTGNVDEVVNLPNGSRVEIIATGIVKSSAEGVLSNTATVTNAANSVFIDPDLRNNSATDNDTLLSPAADLVVTKTLLNTEIIPGLPVSYEINVENFATGFVSNKPSDIQQVMVTDILSESIDAASWTCEAFPKPGLLGDIDGQTNDFLIFDELDYYVDLAISDNGLWAYLIAEHGGESLLLVYARDLRSGSLTEIQRIANQSNGVTGLLGAARIALHGNNLYLVSATDDALVAFQADGQTGELTHLQTLTDGVSGVNGLGGAIDVVTSLDGRHVYVAGQADDAIAIFQRHVSTGMLSFESFVAGVEGLNGLNSMAFNDSGSHLLVAAEDNMSLAIFERMASDGSLSLVDVIQDFEVPGALAQPQKLTVMGSQVFVSNFADDVVSVFETGAAFDELSLSDSIALPPGSGPSDLLLSEAGAQLYVANEGADRIGVFHYREGQYEWFDDVIYSSTLIAELAGLESLIFDHEQAFIYALAGGELVVIHRLPGSHCATSGDGHINDLASIVSEGHLTYQVSGMVLDAATGQLDNTATALIMGNATELNPIDNESTVGQLMVPHSDLSISKDDGLTEVVAGTDSSYQITVTSAGPSTVFPVINDPVPMFPASNAGFLSGSLAWQCSVSDPLQFNAEYDAVSLAGIVGASDMLMSADGQWLFVTSATDNSLSVYSKDSSGGLLWESTVSEGDMLGGSEVTGLTGAAAMAFDTEESFLYVAAKDANAVVVFEITAPGQLAYVSTHASGNEGIIGMSSPVHLVVPADNSGLYVAAQDSDAITVFKRNANDGKLTFVERVKDGFGTIVPESNVIIDVNSLIMSPDNKHLYATALFSDAISIFERNPITQVLTFVDVIRSGDDAGGQVVPLLDELVQPVMTPNGQFLYLLSSGTAELLRFSRDDSDGSLSLLQVLGSGDVGTGPMDVPVALSMSPDSAQLLVVDQAAAAVTLYDRDSMTGALHLVDVFSDAEDAATMMQNPHLIVNEGTYVFVHSMGNDAMTAVQITANAACDTQVQSEDVVALSLEMSPNSAANLNINGRVHPSARGVIENHTTIDLPLGSVEDNPADNAASDSTQIIIETDVNVEKTGPATAVAGTSITYDIVLTNSGPSDALDVQVLDVIPNGLLNATWTCEADGRSVCITSQGTGDIDTRVNVTIDGEVLIQIEAMIHPNYYGPLVNEATASVVEEGYVTDQDLSNNVSSFETEVSRVAELSIDKDNGLIEVVAGTWVSYDIIVSNQGPSDAENTVVSDVMPLALEQVTWSCVAGQGSSCTVAGSGDINDVIYLANGSSVMYQVTAWLPSGAMGELENTASIALGSHVTDPSLDDHVATDTDTIIQIADLEVRLSDQIDPLDPLGPYPLVYDLSVFNHGPSDAQGVVVELINPGDADVVSLPNPCFELNAIIECNYGTLVAGTQLDENIEVRYDVITPGKATNTVTISADTQDSDYNNNSSFENTELLTGIDVRISKTDYLEAIDTGATTHYLIVVENIGSLDAPEVLVNEILPAGLIDTSWMCEAFNGATCVDVTANDFEAELSLPSGGRVELILTATVDPALQDMSQSDITNEVVVVVTNGDYHTDNNQAEDTNQLIFYIFRNGFEAQQP